MEDPRESSNFETLTDKFRFCLKGDEIRVPKTLVVEFKDYMDMKNIENVPMRHGEDVLAEMLANTRVPEPASVSGVSFIDEEDPTSGIRAKFTYGEMVATYADLSYGKYPGLVFDVIKLILRHNAEASPKACQEVFRAASSALSTLREDKFEKIENYVSDVSLPLLSAALTRQTKNLEHDVTNTHLMRFLSQFEFGMARKGKVLTYMCAGKTLDFNMDTGMPIGSPDAFLEAWHYQQSKVRVRYHQISPLAQFTTMFFMNYFNVGTNGGKFVYTENASYIEILVGMSSQMQKNSAMYFGKHQQTLYQLVVPQQKEFEKRRTYMVWDAHAIVFEKALTDDELLRRNMIAWKERLQKRFEADFLLSQAQDLQAKKISSQDFSAKVGHTLGQVVAVRKIEQGKRNGLGREVFTKGMCSQNFPELPSRYDVSAKFENLFKKVSATEYPADVFGTARMAFLAAIKAKYKTCKYYDIDTNLTGTVCGVNVVEKSILTLLPDEGRGKILIDDTFIADKYLQHDKTAGQYIKVPKIIAAGYSAVIAKFMLTDAKEFSAHPLLEFYRCYEKVRLRRTGKAQSLEFFVIAEGLRKDPDPAAGGSNAIDVFHQSAGAQCVAANRIMTNASICCIRPLLPKALLQMCNLEPSDAELIPSGWRPMNLQGDYRKFATAGTHYEGDWKDVEY